MYNEIFRFLANYKVKDCALRYNQEHNIEGDVDLTPVFPPKDDAKQEDKDKYAEYLKNLMKAQEIYYNDAQFIMDPKNQKLESVSYLQGFADRLKKENPELDKNFKVSSFTEEESKKRTQVMNSAQSVMADYQAKSQVYQSIFNECNKTMPINVPNRTTDTRTFSNFMVIGCQNINEYMKRMEILSSGDKVKKQELFEHILLQARDIMNDLSVSKSDFALCQYMSKNMLSVAGLAELDGDKIENIANYLGFDYKENSKGYKLMNDLGGMANTISGVSTQRIAYMSNPYYPIMDDKDCAFFGQGLVEDDVLDATSESLNEMAESKISVVGAFNAYKSASMYSKLPNYDNDLVKLYFLNHPGVTLVKEDGSEIKNPSDNMDAIIEDLKEKKPFIVKNDKGEFVSRISINADHYSGIVTDDDRIPEIDFKNNPVESIHYIQGEMKKLTGWFNHQEYKNLKAYIGSFEHNYKKNPENLDEMVNHLGDLAKKYVESKYMKGTPEKNETTYKREVFFNKLYKQAVLYEDPEAFKLPKSSYPGENVIENDVNKYERKKIEIKEIDEKDEDVVPFEEKKDDSITMEKELE